MRLIIAAFAVALSWLSVPANAQSPCSSHDKVLADAKLVLPNAVHTALNKEATTKLLSGMKREFNASPELEGDSAFMFADPNRPNLLIVTFVGTCAKHMFAISPAQFAVVMKDSSI